MIFKPTLDSVQYVAANMRQVDKDEIYPLRFSKDPGALARTVMTDSRYVWLAAKEHPIAVFGMYEVRPRSWTAFAFATDDFPKIAYEVTKFLTKHVREHLFSELHAVRVEAHSHPDHREAHRWLKRLGATATLDPEYGPSGEPYQHFIMRRSDWELMQQKKRPRIGVSQGGNRESPTRHR